MLEQQAGNYQLARQLFRCAVKAFPQSEPSWKVTPVVANDPGVLPHALYDHFQQHSRHMSPRLSAHEPTVAERAYNSTSMCGCSLFAKLRLGLASAATCCSAGHSEQHSGHLWLATCLVAVAVINTLVTCCPLQAWAQMEEDLGFLQRADDLRRYSIEEQQEVRPAAGTSICSVQSTMYHGYLQPQQAPTWHRIFVTEIQPADHLCLNKVQHNVIYAKMGLTRARRDPVSAWSPLTSSRCGLHLHRLWRRAALRTRTRCWSPSCSRSPPGSSASRPPPPRHVRVPEP